MTELCKYSGNCVRAEGAAHRKALHHECAQHPLESQPGDQCDGGRGGEGLSSGKRGRRVARSDHGLGRVWTSREGMYLHLQNITLTAQMREGRCEQEIRWRTMQDSCERMMEWCDHGRQNNGLKDVHALIPGACECVTLHGQRDFGKSGHRWVLMEPVPGQIQKTFTPGLEERSRRGQESNIS